jgi:hypothetical protein
VHLAVLALWRWVSDAIEFRRLRRRLPSAHRAWSQATGKLRPETDAEYLARLRTLARERERWGDQKGAAMTASAAPQLASADACSMVASPIAASENEPKRPAQPPDHEHLADALSALEEAMAALRARAETAEKCAEAAAADRQVAQARADHAAAGQEEANHRADALKVLLDATQCELAALRSLVDAIPHDAEKLQDASGAWKRGRPRSVAGDGEAIGHTDSFGSARVGSVVRAGAATAATLGRRTG